MLPIISGTIHSAGKLMELENKWQQKKSSGKIFQKEMTPEERQLKQYQEDLKKMRESSQLSAVTAKLKSGQELSYEEIEYLQKNNPELYREYQEIKSEKEAYKRQLKECKTKEDVEKLKINKMNGYVASLKAVVNNPNIPKSAKKAYAEKMLMKVSAIQDAHMDFVRSTEYKHLPTEEELAEEKKEKFEAAEAVSKEPGAEDNTEDGIDEVPDGSGEEAADGEITEEMKTAEELEETLDTLQEKAENVFQTAKRELTEYLTADRESGYGLEYMTGDLEAAGSRMRKL